MCARHKRTHESHPLEPDRSDRGTRVFILAHEIKRSENASLYYLFIYLFIGEKEVRHLKTMACGPDKETSVGDTIPPSVIGFHGSRRLEE